MVSCLNVVFEKNNHHVNNNTIMYIFTVEGSFITFEPPIKSDAGSYWCRSKVDHSNRAEGVLLFLGMCINDQM